MLVFCCSSQQYIDEKDYPFPYGDNSAVLEKDMKNQHPTFKSGERYICWDFINGQNIWTRKVCNKKEENKRRTHWNGQ